jgi:hypothetical protein
MVSSSTLLQVGYSVDLTIHQYNYRIWIKKTAEYDVVGHLNANIAEEKHADAHA